MRRTGSDASAILRLAVPATAGYLGFLLFELVDVFWIARLGTETLAGAASAGFLGWMMDSLGEATTIGCATLVAQAVGAGDLARGRRAAREAAHLSLLVGAGIFLALWPSGPVLLRWMGLTPAAQEAGWLYFRVILGGLFFRYLFRLAIQVFNAHGETRTSMFLLTGALALNAVLDPLLIFGIGPFPRWGIAGAAAASVLSLAAGLAAAVVILGRRGHIPALREFTRWSTGSFLRILQIGAPTASAHFIWTLVYPMLTTVISRFGMAPIAAMTISHRFEGIAYFTCLGFSIATATLVGQRVGAGDVDGARRLAYRARKLVSLILLPVCAVFLLVPGLLLGLMTSEPDVIAHGARYLRIIGLLDVFLGWELVLEGGFNGIGNTRPYMLICVPLTFARYPAALVLVSVFGCGIDAVWWSISVSTMLKGLALSWWFRRTPARAPGRVPEPALAFPAPPPEAGHAPPL